MSLSSTFLHSPKQCQSKQWYYKKERKCHWQVYCSNFKFSQLHIKAVPSCISLHLEMLLFFKITLSQTHILFREGLLGGWNWKPLQRPFASTTCSEARAIALTPLTQYQINAFRTILVNNPSIQQASKPAVVYCIACDKKEMLVGWFNKWWHPDIFGSDLSFWST